jgi:hypothetical protein
MSFVIAGGASAGCLGSTRRLDRNVRCDNRKPGSENSPSPVKILKIAMVLTLLKGSLQVLLYFRNSLQSVWNLKSLHIFQPNIYKIVQNQPHYEP